MISNVYLFLGFVAMAVTVLTIRANGDQDAIITGLMGTIAWLLWAYSSLNVVVVSQGADVAHQYPSLAVFGLLMAVPNFFVALTGPLQLADQRELVGEID